MRSPFAIFRKHAKVLTVVLTGLAMFAFVVMDQIRDNPHLFPIILSALLLGTAFWILGRPTGNSTEYGIGGMLLGVILMVYVVPLVSKPAAAVTLTIGSLTDKELNDSVRRMQEANRFVARAMLKAGQRPSRDVFGFGRGPGEDAVMAFILNHEAEQMGIQLSDDAINKFITTVTANKLSQSEFKEVRTEMRLGETELYNILREQLQAQVAMQMLMPRNFTTPANYWDYFRRLNVKQEIKVAAVPVSAFVSENKLEDGRISAFFEQYKNNVPGNFVSPEPAFGQPRKVRLAYLEVDYEKVRRQVEQEQPISEEDIEKYYEENKEERYQDLPSFEDSITPPFEDSALPDEEKPLEPVIAPDPGPKLKDKQPEKASPDEKGAAEKKAGEASKTPPEKNNPKKNDKAQFSVQDDAAKDAAVTDPAPSTGQPEHDENAPVEAPVPEDPDAPVRAPDPPPPPKYLPLDDELRDEIRDELLHARAVVEVADIRTKAYNFMREIDDEYNLNAPRTDSEDRPLKPEEIKEIADRARAIVDSVKQFAGENDLHYVELDLYSFEELTERGKKAADLWNEIKGSDADAGDEDNQTLKYLVAQATETSPADEGFGTDRLSVLQVVFGSQQDRLYSPDQAQDDLSDNQYIYWKTENKKQHVPKLDDPGIRDQVAAALRQFEARKPARERAEELAVLARKAVEGGKSLEEALAGQKLIADKKDSLELTVLDNGESFSWLTISTAQSPNPFAKPPPVLSTPTAIEHAGNEFMRVAFHGLGVGEIGVAPNADRSVYYIVQVKTRTATKQGGLTALRDLFMQEKLFGDESPFFGRLPSSYTNLTSQDRREAIVRWSNQLLKKYSTGDQSASAP